MSVLAVAVRFLPWKSSISGSHVLFIQPDAYYHLRRATIIAKNFPFYPTLDTYMAYPLGAEPPWPPLYDFFIAAVSLAAGWGDPSARTIQLVTAILPPVLAGMTVVPAFLLVREIFGQRVALVAAFFAVMMPGQLSYSVVGSGDHHVAEVLFATLFFYLLLKALRLAGVVDSAAADRGEGEGGDLPRGGSPVAAAVLSGVSLGVSTLIWQGSMVFAAIGTLYLVILIARAEEKSHRSECVKIGGTKLLVAAAIAAAARAAIPPATEQTVFNFGFFSWFQPFFLVLLFLSLAGISRVASFARRRNRDRNKGMGAAVFFLLAVAGAAALVPSVRNNLLAAAAFVLRKHPYLRSISEFQPLIGQSPWIGVLDLKFVFDLLYLSGFFIPLLICLRMIWTRRKGGILDGEIFFLIWTLLFGCLTLQQKRWGNVYSVNMAAGIGVFVVSLLDRTRLGQKILSEFFEWRRETGRATGETGIFSKFFLYSRRFPKIFTVCAAALFFIPYYFFVFSLVFTPGPVIHPDLYNSLVWIRLNTPPTEGLWNPVKKPEYSIMAPWDLGHYIQYLSERPTVANNFGYQLQGEGLEDSVRFLLTPEEKDLAALCDRRGVKYLVLTDVFPGLDTMGPIIGIDFLREYTRSAVMEGHPGGDLRVPNDRFYSLASQRMYVFDSSATPNSGALEHFRLVFESKNSPGSIYLPENVKYVKLFEKVKGARIVGKGTPGLPVTVSVRMMTNFDRFFDYVALASVDEAGNFAVTVPYASEGAPYPVAAVSPYLAMNEKKAIFFRVTEKDVAEGRKVRVDLMRSGFPALSHRAVRIPSLTGKSDAGEAK